MLLHAIVSILSTTTLPFLLKLYNHRFPQRSAESLTALWSLAILSLAFVLLSTWVVEKTGSTAGAMVLIALTGFAWALTTWAPYALVSDESCLTVVGDLNLLSHCFSWAS